MRPAWVLIGLLTAASPYCRSQAAPPDNAGKLVREVVYNELHDHDSHGYFRYWVEQHVQDGTRVEEQVETADGPVARMVLNHGQRLDAMGEALEEARLNDLRNSPSQRANTREAYREDEERIGRILKLLPDAFVFQEAGTDSGCRHLRFTPNPKFAAHSIEARVFHHLSGDLWIDTRMKRVKRLEGHLDDNVDFGFGMLGRVNKGGWFRMVRIQVSPVEWKTDCLEVHMSGRALMFKTIARDMNEIRGGFEPVKPAMSFEQGLRVLEQSVAEREAAMSAGHVSPAALLVKNRE